MRSLRVLTVLVTLGLLVSAAGAAALDGSAPMLCALTSVVDCPRSAACDRTTPEAADVPPFVRINVAQRLLSSADGGRTSPIAAVQRANGRLMIQGMQNERVWGAVIDEQTGQMSATVALDDAAIVLAGTCIVP